MPYIPGKKKTTKSVSSSIKTTPDKPVSREAFNAMQIVVTVALIAFVICFASLAYVYLQLVRDSFSDYRNALDQVNSDRNEDVNNRLKTLEEQNMMLMKVLEKEKLSSNSATNQR